MQKGACVYFPEQQCNQNACPVVPFLRSCPLLAAPLRERRPPAAARRGARSAARGIWRHPAAVWLVVLGVIFATEYVVMLILPWLMPPEPSVLLEAAVDAVILIAVIAPVIWWTAVRPLKEVIHLRTEFLTELFSRIETDRRGTAHELHDGVGQSLSLLVSGLRSACDATDGPDQAARGQQLLKLAQEALAEVKRMALGLRPHLLDDLGLAPALERLADDVRENVAIDLAVDTSEIAGMRFPEPVETAAFRIVQEAIANLVAHSGAQAASLAVRRRGGNLEIEVVDNGRGFNVADNTLERAGHLGLVGMRERASLLGGRLTLSSAPGRGTRITASIPAGE